MDTVTSYIVGKKIESVTGGFKDDIFGEDKKDEPSFLDRIGLGMEEEEVEVDPREKRRERTEKYARKRQEMKEKYGLGDDKEPLLDDNGRRTYKRKKDDQGCCSNCSCVIC